MQSHVTNSPSAVSLHLALRRLWSDHVIWTREYVVAAVAGTPDADAAATRLLKNQEDIGNAIVPLYGDAAGRALTDLLKQHILIAVDLVAAAKSGDTAKFEVNDRKWTENAEQIASLLSGANPSNWSKADVTDLLMQHLNLTKSEVVARLHGDWEADVAAFDQIFTEILTVAEVLADGIVRQFPEKFAA
ncbi:MAG TPA: glycosyltransferase [Candidatus Dormibacteraeota bacterium]|nr:glycosyltransferase [Candidatus Dormibacteraeota bacterium]